MNTDKTVHTSNNGQKPADNYPTDNYPTDSYPSDSFSPKDSSRYSHPDKRPQKDGPGGEEEA